MEFSFYNAAIAVTKRLKSLLTAVAWQLYTAISKVVTPHRGDYSLSIDLVLLNSSLSTLLQELVLHCWGCCGLVFHSYRLTVPKRLQPQPSCLFVNQLDTARRFMWNEVTSARGTVDPAASINQRRNDHGIPWN